MKILFLLPRFHTNHIEIIKLHKDLGHDLDIHVKTYGKIEDHTLIKPVLFQEFFLTKYIKKLINFQFINNSLYLPKILLLGKDCKNFDENQKNRIRREKISIIFQDNNLLSDFNTVENVLMPLIIRGEIFLISGLAFPLIFPLFIPAT